MLLVALGMTFFSNIYSYLIKIILIVGFCPVLTLWEYICPVGFCPVGFCPVGFCLDTIFYMSTARPKCYFARRPTDRVYI